MIFHGKIMIFMKFCWPPARWQQTFMKNHDLSMENHDFSMKKYAVSMNKS